MKRFRDAVQGMDHCEDVDLRGALRLTEEKVRIPRPSVPLQLLLGGEDGYRLHLYPELEFDAHGRPRHSGDYLLIDPSRYFSDISGFLRLTQGDTLTLGRHDAAQRLLLHYPKVVDDKHLRLKLSHKGLALKCKSEHSSACVAPLLAEDLVSRMTRWRHQKIAHLHQLLGGPIEPLERYDALALIEQVLQIMRDEPYRVPNGHGRPSGLLALPERPAPIFVGDLHANIDNLLVILTQNGFLEALIDGSAILILLGDAVQPDVASREAEMESSMLMMDLIFRLKVLLPERVFYLRGNHDSFSEDISKAGIPQGLLWEQALQDKRGRRYRDAMQQLYDHLPYVAASAGYLACHAGPPTGKLSWETLTDISRHPKLAHQLTHVRLRRPNIPHGYGPGDVARMRKRLGVKQDTPLVVGHTPLSSDAAFWLNAGGITNHHVLYGADPGRVSVITRADKQLIPLVYPSEPLLGVYNRYASSRTEPPNVVSGNASP